MPWGRITSGMGGYYDHDAVTLTTRQSDDLIDSGLRQ